MEKCKECESYHGHSPRCSKIDKEEAIKQLHQYYELWLERENKWSERESRLKKKLNRYRDEMEFWKGKYWSIKQENNKLRKENNYE